MGICIHMSGNESDERPLSLVARILILYLVPACVLPVKTRLKQTHESKANTFFGAVPAILYGEGGQEPPEPVLLASCCLVGRFWLTLWYVGEGGVAVVSAVVVVVLVVLVVMVVVLVVHISSNG